MFGAGKLMVSSSLNTSGTVLKVYPDEATASDLGYNLVIFCRPMPNVKIGLPKVYAVILNFIHILFVGTLCISC